MLELKHLRLLAALDRHGSLSGAAREIGCSQPAASQQLQSLERSTGTPLAVRGPSGLRLTEAGRLLVERGGPVLAAVAQAEAEVTAIADLRAGHVRLAAFAGAVASLVPDAVARLRRRHPDLRLSLTDAEPPDAVALLRAGEVDVALVHDWDGVPTTEGIADLEVVPLLWEDVRLVTAAGDPLAATPGPVPLASLAQASWIAGCERCRSHLVDACAAAGFTPDITFEAEDHVAVQSLAAHGLGLALVPELVLTAVQVDGLAVLDVDPPARRRVGLVTTPGMARVPGVQAAAAAFLASAHALAQRSPGLSLLPVAELTSVREKPGLDES
ncbi:LysR family transcriptional regulator [Nocardioides bruguierae]|uniref:LysR family transcriptional regulator n=1 Tax=Nocardioides bruguierae TaxID=2945102 RepID=UPI002021375D|nr:LysR family transcriptional regulator [Nocardioides bruguierae]MCL8027447.1 LysR family transcriptional regulator [Nocardioides bruguierae]